MKKGTIILLVIVGIIVLLIGGFISVNNTIITKEEKVNNALSNIDTNLERRADLIPNLVNTVKGYSIHEQDAIDKVTDARTKLMDAKSLSDKSSANEELSLAINNLLVVVENYPDLKASQNFIQLQDELAGTENRIAVSRRDYNKEVNEYNTYIKKFPTSIIANMTNHGAKEYFKADSGAKKVPEVSFE